MSGTKFLNRASPPTPVHLVPDSTLSTIEKSFDKADIFLK
jgi:hypothetical protein